MSGDWVVDASVGIKLFVAEELSEVADTLFARLAAQPPTRLYVPDLFYIECANILWKYVQRFGYPVENARQDVADLTALSLVTVSTADLLGPALEEFLEAALRIKGACQELVSPENRAKYRAQVQVSFGIYLDAYWNPKGSSWYIDGKGGSRVERLAANVR